jgi:uncharacterized protein (TIGR03000 family)
MYSAVLMLALTAGNDAVDFGRHKCHGGTTGCAAPVDCTPVCTTCSSSCHGGLFHRLRERRCHGAATTCTVHSEGCSGSVGCSYSSDSVGCSSGPIMEAPPVMKAKEMPKGEPEKVPPPKKTSLTVPATIVVSLPADARLFVDGAPTSSTSERRALVTPGLEVGTTYFYTVRAEVVRDGLTMEQTQRVLVRGGISTPVHFDFSTQFVASR